MATSLVLLIVSSLICRTRAQDGGGVPPSNSRVTPGYKCDSSSCRLPSCLCPSSDPPGGKKPPLFITLTFDDSINQVVLPVIEALTGITIFITNISIR
jgi:hypothetical protein